MSKLSNYQIRAMIRALEGADAHPPAQEPPARRRRRRERLERYRKELEERERAGCDPGTSLQSSHIVPVKTSQNPKSKPERLAQLRLFNPARGLVPAELVTDRAKRYRAQQSIEQRERRCIYCGRPGGPLQVEHINGKEADGSGANLAYVCRPCNTLKGALFARLGLGSRTHQFNPPAEGAINLAQWSMAVASIKKRDPRTGRLRQHDSNKMRLMPVAQAVAMIRATPPDKRSEYARQIWSLRRQHGTDRSAVPF